MGSSATRLLDAIVPMMRSRLPAGVDAGYLDAFIDRNRPMLVLVIEQNLGPVLARMDAANQAFPQEDIPEFWTAAKRTAANVAAMVVASRIFAERRVPNADERAGLAGYSGWGGSRSRQPQASSRPASPLPKIGA